MGQNASADGNPGQDQRLDSWKSIAGFFNRDVRTVKRWERDRDLPVHRVPGGERGTVFAYTGELRRWLDQRSPEEALDAAAVSSSEAKTVALSQAAFLDPRVAVSPDTGIASSATTIAKLDLAPPRRSRWRWAVVAAALIVLLVAALQAVRMVHWWPLPVGHARRAVHVPNAEAEALYLKGRYYWNQRTADSLNRAVDLFTQSIVNDPQYAQAYVGLADCYLLLREFGQMPDAQAFPRALAAAHKAIELDDSASEAHRSIALALCYWSWDMPAAEREFRRALQLDPNDVEAHHWFATSLIVHGRVNEALTQIDAAWKLQPSSTSILADRALILSAAGDRAEAIASLLQIQEIQPGFLSTHRYLARIYLSEQNYAKYLDELRKGAELSHDDKLAASVERAAQDLNRGGPAAMLRTLAQGYAENSTDEKSQASTAAALFALSGDKENAFKQLEISYARHESDFISIATDPAYDSMRNDPRFNRLVALSDVSSSKPRSN